MALSNRDVQISQAVMNSAMTIIPNKLATDSVLHVDTHVLLTIYLSSKDMHRRRQKNLSYMYLAKFPTKTR